MVAAIIIDIILIAVFVVGLILGIKKGFFIVLAKPIKIILSIIIAASICSFVASAIIQPVIEEPITVQLTDFLTEKCEEFADGKGIENVPTLLKFAADMAGIDISNISGDSIEDYAAALVNTLAVPVVHFLAVIISFILLYIIARVLLWPVFMILNYFMNHGVIGVINKILGAVFGIVVSFLICWLLVCVFGYLLGLPFLAEVEWALSFEGGFIYKFFRQFSLLELLLSF